MASLLAVVLMCGWMAYRVDRAVGLDVNAAVDAKLATLRAEYAALAGLVEEDLQEARRERATATQRAKRAVKAAGAPADAEDAPGGPQGLQLLPGLEETREEKLRAVRKRLGWAR